MLQNGEAVQDGEGALRVRMHGAIGTGVAGLSPVVWLGVLAVLGPIVTLFVVTQVLGLHPARALRDPASYLAYPFYVGGFSHLGVLGWWSAAAFGALGAVTLRAGSAERQAMQWAALLSAMLALDDLFMVHEEVVPTYVGLPDVVPIGLLGVVAVVYLWRFRMLHLQIAPVLLALALLFLGGSVALDQLRHGGADESGIGVLFEDGAKLTGICCWALYHGVLARSLLLGHMRPRGAR